MFVRTKLTRLLSALSIVILVLLQVVHFGLSILAFEKLWSFYDSLVRSSAGKWELVLAVFASLSPLVAASLLMSLISPGVNSARIVGWIAAATTVYYAMSLTLLAYRLETGVAVDPFLLWFHGRDTWGTIIVLGQRHWSLAFVMLGLLWLFYRGFVNCLMAASRASLKLGSRSRRLLPVFLVAVFVAVQWPARSGLANLLLEFRQPYSQARVLYTRYVEDSIRRNLEQRPAPTGIVPGDNLFVFQLESLNAQLVNSQFTPHFAGMGRSDGILFPRVQASTVFTILAKETILCSVLPTIGENLSHSAHLFGKLHCLPEIMRRLGYRTVYFQNFPNIEFANANAFLGAIGFEERHSADIMQPTDEQFSWGYAEDIFYQRVFDYLQRFKGQRVFAYILVGATNHYPFVIDDRQKQLVRAIGGLPFAKAQGIRQQVANTTFLQDHYFGQAYNERFLPEYGDTSHAILLGDHSWPIGSHPGNEHNLTIDGSYQENFETAFAILPSRRARAGQEYQTGRTIDSYHTQLDLLPTVLAMYGAGETGYYGRSFFSRLRSAQPNDDGRRCLVSVQPFAGGSIVLLQYPLKYVFVLRTGMVTRYDLAQDPEELSKQQTAIGSRELRVLEDCLTSIRDRVPVPAHR